MHGHGAKPLQKSLHGLPKSPLLLLDEAHAVLPDDELVLVSPPPAHKLR